MQLPSTSWSCDLSQSTASGYVSLSAEQTLTHSRFTRSTLLPSPPSLQLPGFLCVTRFATQTSQTLGSNCGCMFWGCPFSTDTVVWFSDLFAVLWVQNNLQTWQRFKMANSNQNIFENGVLFRAVFRRQAVCGQKFVIMLGFQFKLVLCW